MKSRINKVFASALEKEDDLNASIALLETHIGLFSVMVSGMFSRSIANWVQLQINGHG
jgi:hypothetical protein